MVGVFLSYILDPKIVDYQCEGDRSRLVCLQPRDVLALKVAVLVQMFLQQLVYNDSRLREPVHSFAYLDVDRSVWRGNVA